MIFHLIKYHTKSTKKIKNPVHIFVKAETLDEVTEILTKNQVKYQDRYKMDVTNYYSIAKYNLESITEEITKPFRKNSLEEFLDSRSVLILNF
jgi:hypothetical protein